MPHLLQVYYSFIALTFFRLVKKQESYVMPHVYNSTSNSIDAKQ